MKPLQVTSPDWLFSAGFHALQKELTLITGQHKRIHALHFPDMRFLLEWSRKPVLHEDITLIVGSERVLAVLHDLFNPEYVLLVGRHDACHTIKARLQRALEDNKRLPPEQIRLTSREMVYMWGYINGYLYQSDNKRDSQIRRQVMSKIGAENWVSLLIRFRLLFYLPPWYLRRVARMQGSSEVDFRDLKQIVDHEVIVIQDKLPVRHT